MKIFSKLYERTITWSRHRSAPYYLAGLSFAESSFFPIPPDFMLAPMSLANPRRAWNYALLTTVASVLGGLFGYLVGACAFAWIHPWIVHFGYEPLYLRIKDSFQHWGFWIIFIAGFSPIPYKLFTIASGTLHIGLLPFTFSSFIGRGGRFFLVALLASRGGKSIEQLLMKYIDRIAWAVVLALIIAWGCYRLSS